MSVTTPHEVRACGRTGSHEAHTHYRPRDPVEYSCPGLEDDHEKRCCTEHGTHTMPHVGCILR